MAGTSRAKRIQSFYEKVGELFRGSKDEDGMSYRVPVGWLGATALVAGEIPAAPRARLNVPPNHFAVVGLTEPRGDGTPPSYVVGELVPTWAYRAPLTEENLPHTLLLGGLVTPTNLISPQGKPLTTGELLALNKGLDVAREHPVAVGAELALHFSTLFDLAALQRS